MSALPSIAATVNANITDGRLDTRALVDALVAREDAMADVLRLAGVQFGLYPEIVAKVLTDVGIGSPVSDETKALITNQFNNLMTRLQEEYRRQNPND